MADPDLDAMVAEALQEQDPPAIDEVEAAFQARYPTAETTPEPEPDQEVEEEGGEEGEPAPELDAPPAPPAADLIELAPGQSYTRDDLAKAAAFHAWLNAPENEQYARGLVEYLQSIQQAPPATPEPAPAAAEPPPGLDLEDPAIKALWDEIQATKLSVAQANQQAMLAQQQEQLRQRQEVEAIANRARASFMETNVLSAADMDKLDAFLTRTQIAGPIFASLQRGIHPITGAPATASFSDAATISYEIALTSDPALNAQRMKAVAEKEKASRQKKAKLGALSGSSGSRPRSAPVPQNSQDLQKAFLDEVRSIMQGTSQEN